jgi:hypothetical protein
MPTHPGHNRGKKLALGELEALAGTFLSVLLALMFAGIARQKAGLLQRAAQFRIKSHQRTGDTQTDCSGLTGNATAMRQHQNVETFGHFHRAQGLLHGDAASFGGKIIFECTPVDGDLTRPRPQKYTGNARLAASRSQILLDLF